MVSYPRFIWSLALGLGICLLAAGSSVRAEEDEGDDELDADTALLSAWWDVTLMIDADAPWADCRAALEAELVDHPGTSHEARCRLLLTGIEQAERAAENVPRIHIDSDVTDLIAALPRARISPGWALMPLQFYSSTAQTVWEFHAQRVILAPESSALMVYMLGRSAVPSLIEKLDDLTATRSVSTDRSRLTTPVVLRVCDISLALIEAISLCRFGDMSAGAHRRSGPVMLLSGQTETDRAALIAEVREWWRATRDLPPDEAVLWRLERADRDQQLEMLDALIATGRRTAALRFLYGRYHDGLELDEQFADRLIRAGSRAPLDFLHHAVRMGRPVDHAMVALIAAHGEAEDYQLLRKLIADGCVEGKVQALPVDTPMVVNVLNYSENRLCVPVLVAVLQKDYTPSDDASARLPAYLGRAADKIALMTGADVEFDSRDTAERRRRGIEEILQWWENEGRGAYDYEMQKPHAPSGIR